MTQKLVNLTGRPLTLQLIARAFEEPETITLPPSDSVCRLAAAPEVPHATDTVWMTRRPIARRKITGLPKPQPDTIYIVDQEILAALEAARKFRDDVFAPDSPNPETGAFTQLVGMLPKYKQEYEVIITCHDADNGDEWRQRFA
ncbi:MAG: hypothetical protein RML32_10300, partial [Gammaproteobacteria bacterium]|nr:hypothetical protein [Gammaproteobacteria bacterium]